MQIQKKKSVKKKKERNIVSVYDTVHLFLDDSFFYLILSEEVQPLKNLIDPLNYKYHHAGKLFPAVLMTFRDDFAGVEY